jgi:DNA polymerase-3 subunit gamma/tau
MAQQYQVVARKYRPQTFKSVVGQEAIVTTLKNSLKTRRFAHAYLFCGMKGTGKTSLARILAKALNCKNLDSECEPCNSCPSCLEITGGRSLDVMEIDGASNRGIEDIRQLNETVSYAPASGEYKIYIIDEVHMLTKEAFNALLKTLEEPPKTVKFFFATTEPNKVLPTIISRCQRFDLSPIPTPLIAAKLSEIARDMGVDVEPEAIHLIAHLAEGGLRDAESLFDQIASSSEGKVSRQHVSSLLGRLPRTILFDLDRAIASHTLAHAFELADTLFSTGCETTMFLSHLMEHFRLILRLKLQPSHPLPLFLSDEEISHYKKVHTDYSEPQCLYILETLNKAMENLSKTLFKRVTVESILLQLIRSRTRITLDSLVQRLTKLESGPKPAPAPVTAAAPQPVAPPPAPAPAPEQKSHETLLRFAAVELEATLRSQK